MKKYLIPLILIALLTALPSCATGVDKSSPEALLENPGLETLTELGDRHTFYFYHDTERHVGIWIAKSRWAKSTPTIFVLPDALYMK